MSISRFLLVACGVMLALSLPAVDAAEESGQKGRPPEQGGTAPLPDPEITPELRARIDALVKGLGAEKFDDRRAARDALLEIGRPALGALRAATSSKDPEVADAAKKLVAEIESGKSRTTVKVKTSGSRQEGNFEITVISSVDTVTVRDFKEAFAVQIKDADGSIQLLSEPKREDFAKKHPEVWKKYAEPALDEQDPERVVREAMLRELIPQARAQFVKAKGREPKPEELAEFERLTREKLAELFKNKKKVRTEDDAGGKEKEPPVVAPRRQPQPGPQLQPMN